MPTTTLRGVVDTYATQVYPKQKSPGSTRLYLRTQSGRSVHAFFRFTGLPSGPGVTITSAELRVSPVSGWIGSTTATLSRVTSKWEAPTLAYNAMPSVTSTGAVSRSVSGVGANQIVALDATAFAQAWASGTENFGVRLSSTGTALQRLHSSEGKVAPDLKPTLVVTYSTRPSATNLEPSGGMVVSTLRPVLTWAYSDVSSSPMNACRVQVNPTNSWTSPAYDSLAVLSSTPSHELPFDADADQWWRVQVRSADGNWSDWSTPARFGYAAKPTLSIAEPVEGGVTTDSSPTVSWNLGAPQIGWQVILRRGTTILADTGYQAGAASFWGRDEPIDYDGGPVTAEVRAWDSSNRASTPGDPAWISATVTYSYEPSSEVPGATGLTATQVEMHPGVDIRWDRATTPDRWKIYRDDTLLTFAAGPDLGDGDGFAWTDVSAAPGRTHLYRVVANDNGEDAAAQPEAAATPRTNYMWILDPDDPEWWLALAGNDMPGLAFGEASEVLTVRGSDRGVLVVDSLRGYEGTVTGGLYDGLPGVGGEGATWLRDRLWHVKRNPTRTYRLIFGDVNIPVALRNVNVLRRPVADAAYAVTFEAYQQGELPWS